VPGSVQALAGQLPAAQPCPGDRSCRPSACREWEATGVFSSSELDRDFFFFFFSFFSLKGCEQFKKRLCFGDIACL